LCHWGWIVTREDVSLQASSSFVLRASEIQLSSFVLKKKKKKKGVMISLYLFYDKKKEAKKREKKEKKRKRDHYRTCMMIPAPS
jgi:hypothetical protein